MADNFDPKVRSRIMSTIRSKNTKPEKLVRSLAHKNGFRFRLSPHKKYNLPCKPDLVFPSKRKVIFVHGCFWHRHNCKKGQSKPTTNKRFWNKKFKQNKERDQRNIKSLKILGWKSLVIWSCQLRDIAKIETKLRKFLK